MKRLIVSTTKIEGEFNINVLGDVVRNFAEEDRENPHLPKRYLHIIDSTGNTIARGSAEKVEQSPQLKEHEHDRILKWDAYFNDVTLTI